VPRQQAQHETNSLHTKRKLRIPAIAMKPYNLKDAASSPNEGKSFQLTNSHKVSVLPQAAIAVANRLA